MKPIQHGITVALSTEAELIPKGFSQVPDEYVLLVKENRDQRKARTYFVCKNPLRLHPAIRSRKSSEAICRFWIDTDKTIAL